MIAGATVLGALKAVAPVLVFFLVMSAISQHKSGQKTNMKSIIVLYLLGTFLAGTLAVVASFIFPVELALAEGAGDVTPPEGIGQVLQTLIFNIVSNLCINSTTCNIYKIPIIYFSNICGCNTIKNSV